MSLIGRIFGIKRKKKSNFRYERKIVFFEELPCIGVPKYGYCVKGWYSRPVTTREMWVRIMEGVWFNFIYLGEGWYPEESIEDDKTSTK